MIEKKIENGLVCFFDILGYKNILINNSIDNCISIIKDVLLKLPQKVIDNMLGLSSSNKLELNEVNDIIKNHFKYIIVSDSVIMFFDYEDLTKYEKSKAIMLSIFIIINFQYYCFESGFPMRSCVDFNSFYYVENVFAGEAIVNSYTESNELDFSGIVITERAGDFIINNIDELSKKYFGMILLSYIVPLKNGLEEKKYLLDWYTTSHDSEFSKDLRQDLFNVFHMHNKTTNQDVLNKINNTENIIRYFMYRKLM